VWTRKFSLPSNARDEKQAAFLRCERSTSFTRVSVRGRNTSIDERRRRRVQRDRRSIACGLYGSAETER
jgi:hypothetical protein